MRIAIRYSRNGPAAYVSHLDMQRAIGRAIRRARLHACYSHGFNPHLQMSFASPLSVGYETRSDYIELEVEDDQDIAEAMEALRREAPPGIEIVGVYRIPDGFGKLMARSDSASYDVTFALENRSQSDYGILEDTVESLKRRDAYLAADKKGRQKDIIPLIHELSWDRDTAKMRLANSSSAALNPAVVADVLLKEAGLSGSYTVARTECYAAGPHGAVPFAELFTTPAQQGKDQH